MGPGYMLEVMVTWKVLPYKVFSIGTRMDPGERVDVGVEADVTGTEAGLGIRTVVGAGVGIEVKGETPKIRSNCRWQQRGRRS